MKEAVAKSEQDCSVRMESLNQSLIKLVNDTVTKLKNKISSSCQNLIQNNLEFEGGVG